jgi:branched-chain amino acid transport system ATP-binding protein
MLSINEIHVAYGPIEVLKGVSLDVAEGSIVSLIGANGAGKTTTLNTISGLYAPKSGSIEFLGERIDGLKPEEVIRKGIAQVPEGRKVFQNLTVYECLLMGGLTRKNIKSVKSDIEGRIFEMFPRLKERRKQLSGTLSGGEQQMLAFGRALVARPKLLLLDEPSMGLAPRLVKDVAEFITQFRNDGVTILLVEQNAELALDICDYGYVMETGRIIFNDRAGDLLANERVKEAYLGI